MTAGFVTRSAQPGDFCVLLRPLVFESKVIRQHQASLQAVFGGAITDDLHLTCQRFEVRSAEALSELTADLHALAKVSEAMALTATHIVPFYSRFRKGHILKIGVTITDELRMFTAGLNDILAQRGISSLYRAQSQTTLVTVLENIERFVDVSNFQELLPFHLFTARQLALSRINGPDDYELIDSVLIG
jgi:hypothetical protein